MPKQKVEDHFTALREKQQGAKPNTAGITPAMISAVLHLIGKDSPDIRDAVFALLDDTLPSQLSGRAGATFADGATTAQIACHVGILQRGRGKLDREGRDYWIKPLREVGAIEPITWVKEESEFVVGHITAKSPLSGYRLESSFGSILRASDKERATKVHEWASKERIRERLTLQAAAAHVAKERFGRGQGALIQAVQDFFAPAYLPDFELIYVDDEDGDRVSEAEARKLAQIGLRLGLAESFPDLIYFRARDRAIWCVEAVTSDGEVDETKRRSIVDMCDSANLTLAGLTTAYYTYKDFAQRQSKHRNIASGTFVWIEDDAANHWLATPPPQSGVAELPPKARG